MELDNFFPQNGTYKIYMMIPPVDLSNQELILGVQTYSFSGVGSCYFFTAQGKNLQAGRAYIISGTYSKTIDKPYLTLVHNEKSYPFYEYAVYDEE